MAKEAPTPMTSAERAARAQQIAQLRAIGATWQAVARETGVSVRQAQRLRQEHLRAAAGRVRPAEPERALEEALAAFEWGMTKLARLAEAADNSSAAVAAVSRCCDLAERRLGLLAAAGLVPQERAGWQAAIELPSVVRAILDVAERHGADLAELKAELQRVAPLPLLNGGGP
jgi:hypothetical protein